jgi:hypothetical protein
MCVLPSYTLGRLDPDRASWGVSSWLNEADFRDVVAIDKADLSGTVLDGAKLGGVGLTPGQIADAVIRPETQLPWPQDEYTNHDLRP